jgi:hypothetical protein
MALLVLAALVAAVGQSEPDCRPATALLADPRVTQVRALGDVARDLEPLSASCGGVALARLYIGGLVAAERAWREGGSEASLVEVRARVAALELLGETMPAVPLARLVLRAQIAAAQNEVGEMALLFEEASAMELRLRLDAGAALPIVSVAEAAGDGWLRLYRYREAEASYLRADARVEGSRVRRALARVRQALQRQPR